MKNKLLLNKFLCIIAFLVVIAFITSCGGGGLSPDVTFGGKVLLQDGTPLEGIEVTFFWRDPPNFESDGILTAVSDEEGWYGMELSTFSPPSDFTITPSHPYYNFSPERYSFTKVTDDHLDLDFIATPKT